MFVLSKKKKILMEMFSNFIKLFAYKHLPCTNNKVISGDRLIIALLFID